MLRRTLLTGLAVLVAAPVLAQNRPRTISPGVGREAGEAIDSHRDRDRGQDGQDPRFGPDEPRRDPRPDQDRRGPGPGDGSVPAPGTDERRRIERRNRERAGRIMDRVRGRVRRRRGR